MNAIFIHDLRVETRIGIYDWEQQLAQTVRLDIELGLPSDKVFAVRQFRRRARLRGGREAPAGASPPTIRTS